MDDFIKMDNIVSFHDKNIIGVASGQFSGFYDETNANEQQYGEYLSLENKRLKVQELESLYQVDEKKVLRKTDLCVVLPFSLLYLIAYFNRSSFGFIEQSKIAQDLNMTKLQYYASYAGFFAPYILFQFFANVLLKQIRPHFWISITVFLFGLVTLCSSFTNNYGVYVFLHVLHGLIQAGSETAVFYIMSHYYTAYESQARFSFVYSVSCLGGILCSGINYGVEKNLTGAHGKDTWKWAVTVFGSLTCFSALILFFILPDFPEGARFFNDSETFFVVRKLEIYNQTKSGYSLKTSFRDYVVNAKDWIVMVPALNVLFVSFGTYLYAFNEPIIMRALDYKGLRNVSYGSLPWVVAFVWCNICGIVATRFAHRVSIVLANLVLAIVGGALVASEGSSHHAQYGGVFLFAAGAYAALPLLLCWSTSNVCGHVRRSLITSLQISFGSIGGIVSLFTFYDHEYNLKTPFIVAVALMGAAIVSVSGYVAILMHRNTQKRTNGYKAKFADLSEKDQVLYGDCQPNFNYAI